MDTAVSGRRHSEYKTPRCIVEVVSTHIIVIEKRKKIFIFLHDFWCTGLQQCTAVEYKNRLWNASFSTVDKNLRITTIIRVFSCCYIYILPSPRGVLCIRDHRYYFTAITRDRQSQGISRFIVEYTYEGGGGGVARTAWGSVWNYRREVDNRYAHKGQRGRGPRGQVHVVHMKNECPTCIYTPSCIYTVSIWVLYINIYYIVWIFIKEYRRNAIRYSNLHLNNII